MIDFKLDISMEDALTTQDWPITPGAVIQAYDKTGLKPTRGAWCDLRIGCACAMGVLARASEDCEKYMQVYQDIDNFGSITTVMILGGLPFTQAGFMPPADYRYCSRLTDWANAFSDGFDYDTVQELEKEVDSIISLVRKDPKTSWRPWEVLAWRNALAVRRVLAMNNMEPIHYGEEDIVT